MFKAAQVAAQFFEEQSQLSEICLAVNHGASVHSADCHAFRALVRQQSDGGILKPKASARRFWASAMTGRTSGSSGSEPSALGASAIIWQNTEPCSERR